MGRLIDEDDLIEGRVENDPVVIVANNAYANAIKIVKEVR